VCCSTESDAREQAALAGLHAINDHHIYGFHMRGEGLTIEESQWRKGSQVRARDQADSEMLCHSGLLDPLQSIPYCCVGCLASSMLRFDVFVHTPR